MTDRPGPLEGPRPGLTTSRDNARSSQHALNVQRVKLGRKRLAIEQQGVATEAPGDSLSPLARQAGEARDARAREDRLEPEAIQAEPTTGAGTDSLSPVARKALAAQRERAQASKIDTESEIGTTQADPTGGAEDAPLGAFAKLIQERSAQLQPQPEAEETAEEPMAAPAETAPAGGDAYMLTRTGGTMSKGQEALTSYYAGTAGAVVDAHPIEQPALVVDMQPAPADAPAEPQATVVLEPITPKAPEPPTTIAANGPKITLKSPRAEVDLAARNFRLDRQSRWKKALARLNPFRSK